MDYNLQQPYPPVVYSNFNTSPNPYLAPQQPRFQLQPAFTAAWVKGEEGAKNYVLQPGATAWLLDQDDDRTFYMKYVDQTGRPVIKKGRYTFDEPIQNQSTEYATKADLDIFSKKIDELREEIDGLSIKKAKKKGEDE